MINKASFFYCPFFVHLLVFSMLILITSCHIIEPSDIDVEISDDGNLISIRAENVPLSSVLNYLDEVEGIKIVIPTFKERNVSIIEKDIPINEAITKLIDKDTQYWVISKNDNINLRGREGKKEGRNIDPRLNLNKKRTSNEDIKFSPRLPGKLYKLPPNKVDTNLTIDTTSVKVSIEQQQKEQVYPKKKDSKLEEPKLSGRYVTLRFNVINDEIKLEKALMIPGQLKAQNYIMGPYLYTVIVDNQIIYTGSFNDPLKMHSYNKELEQPHEIIESKSGTFHISFPGEILDKYTVEEINIEFFKITQDPETQVLSPKTFEKIKRSLKPVTKFEGRELRTNPIFDSADNEGGEE